MEKLMSSVGRGILFQLERENLLNGILGATDQTSRRQMFEAPNSFEHPPFINGPQL